MRYLTPLTPPFQTLHDPIQPKPTRPACSACAFLRGARCGSSERRDLRRGVSGNRHPHPIGKDKFMKTTHIYVTDCDAHSACHSFATALAGVFPDSELSCTEHDSRGLACVHEGILVTSDFTGSISIHSLRKREIEISIMLDHERAETILASIVSAYEARRDAGGFTHTLERK